MSIVPYPTLLLKPDGSHDRNGPVSPILTGAVRVVEGQHGPAWFVEEGTTNLIPDPLFANNQGYWGGANTTIVQSPSVQYNGDPVGQVTVTGASNPRIHRTVSGASVLSWSAKLRGSRVGMKATLSIAGETNGIATSSIASSVVDLLTDEWVEIEVLGKTLAAGETGFRVWVNLIDAQIGDIALVAEPQAEAKPYVTSFAHGGMGTGYTWAGMENQSASTRAANPSVRSESVMDVSAGAVVARYTIPEVANRYLFNIGGLSGPDDSAYFTIWWTGTGMRFRDHHDWARVMAQTLSSPGDESTAYLGWDEDSYYVDLGVGDGMVVVPRAAYDGVWMNSNGRLAPLSVGSAGIMSDTTRWNAPSGPAIAFDRPLTQAEWDEVKSMDSWEWNDFVPKFGGVSISVPDDPILVNVSVPEPKTVNAPVPTLVMAPGDSRDQNGPVSPTLTGGVLEVMTDQGPAWQVAEATTNAFINPSMVTRDNWLAYHGTFAPLPIDTLEAPSEIGGGRMLSVYRGPEVSTDVVSFSIAATTIGTGIPSGLADLQLPFPPSSSSKATISMWMLIDEYTPHPQQYLRAAFTLTFYDASGAPLTSYGRTDLYMDPDVGAWKKLSETFDLPAGTEKFRFSVGVLGAATARVRIAQPQIEAKPYATPYCDGSLGPGHTWAGAAHASSSSRAVAGVAVPSEVVSPQSFSRFVHFRSVFAPQSMVAAMGGGTYHTEGYDHYQVAVFENNTETTSRLRLYVSNGSHGKEVSVSFPRGSLPEWSSVYIELVEGQPIRLQLNDLPMASGSVWLPHAAWGQPHYVGSSIYGLSSLNDVTTSSALFPRPLTDDERAALFAAGPVRMHDFIPKLGGVLVTPGGL